MRYVEQGTNKDLVDFIRFLITDYVMTQDNELLINDEELVIEDTELSALPTLRRVKGKGAGITSIVFTALATIAFAICLFFFFEFLTSANMDLPENAGVSEGLSKGFGQAFAIVFFIIVGIFVLGFSLVGLILSIFSFKWSKVAGFILLFLNILYQITPVILLVVMLLMAN